MPTEISRENPLVLASTSRYRAELLGRLRLPFETAAPLVDERPRPGEAPAELAQRLALAKAQAVAEAMPGRWVLGSDQVPSADGRILGKPGNRENAVAQLASFSGKSVVFHTAIALANGSTALTALDTTVVRFRALSRGEIERYVDAEPAFDCAGSFKVEGLGITLFESIEARDPTALVGLPLIAVRDLLAQVGARIP